MTWKKISLDLLRKKIKKYIYTTDETYLFRIDKKGNIEVEL